MPSLNCVLARAFMALATAIAGESALPANGCGALALTTAAAEVSIDVDALCATLASIATPQANLHGVVVDHAGQVQLEAYFNGTDHPGASLSPVLPASTQTSCTTCAR